MTHLLKRFLIVLAITAVPLAASARTQENAVWSSQSTGDMSALQYGAFDADLPLLLLSCFNELEVAVLDIYDDVGDAKTGDPITIELAAGSIAAPLKGEAAKEEESDQVYAEVSGFPIKPVMNVLRTEGPLTIKIGDTTRTFDGAGREDAVKSFTADCKLD
ncbi:hypothetical protein A7A08_02062 [Methyloligella halotolerans]|uniref:Invasion associated locus B (IalB) protein n=1 Tax=Methyloligella halotolerans TaxID=1177755 RepID=A0A1E2RYX7_9HYPH|nr:hypothetical protein [Methyloligella halotolerans]ODA67315.1 hypothetical protein A7A08_02062 [Methyloligella halotolerans]